MSTYFVKNDFGLRPKSHNLILGPNESSERNTIKTFNKTGSNIEKINNINFLNNNLNNNRNNQNNSNNNEEEIILDQENKTNLDNIEENKTNLKSSFNKSENNEFEDKDNELDKDKEILLDKESKRRHTDQEVLKKSKIAVDTFLNPNPKNYRNIYRLKTILIGNVSVGKTSLMNRFIVNKFSHDYTSSIGVEFKVKSMIIDENTAVDLQIWDTCGQEKFRTLTRQYYRESNAVILIFDLSDKKSFNDIAEWIKDIKEYGPKECLPVLVGNKNDLKNERKISFNEAVEFARKYDMDYFEVSAKNGDGIKFVFEIMGRTLVKSIEEGINLGNFDNLRRQSSSSNFVILKENTKKTGCCN